MNEEDRQAEAEEQLAALNTDAKLFLMVQYGGHYIANMIDALPNPIVAFNTLGKAIQFYCAQRDICAGEALKTIKGFFKDSDCCNDKECDCHD